jgi:hypothetical protein
LRQTIIILDYGRNLFDPQIHASGDSICYVSVSIFVKLFPQVVIIFTANNGGSVEAP